jgi:hypothetical protein
MNSVQSGERQALSIVPANDAPVLSTKALPIKLSARISENKGEGIETNPVPARIFQAIEK